MNYLAIDPGMSGGIAYVDTDGHFHALGMPQTIKDIWDQLSILCNCEAPTTAFIEDVPKGGGVPGCALAVLHGNYNACLMALTAIGATIVKCPPKKWQKAIGAGDKKTYGKRWKNHLKGRAQELFPRMDITLKTADAILILEAGIRGLLN
jgi:hypothetical protein